MPIKAATTRLAINDHQGWELFLDDRLDGEGRLVLRNNHDDILLVLTRDDLVQLLPYLHRFMSLGSFSEEPNQSLPSLQQVKVRGLEQHHQRVHRTDQYR